MPRAPLIRSAEFPYHVCARSNNREWFYLPTVEIWNVFSNLLNKIINDYGIKLHAFVLMSNHFHSLISTPNENLDEAMLYFMREGSKEINRRAERINHIFGGPYKWSVITNRRYYEHAFRYIYQNPIKAKIVERVQDYPFSTIHYLHNEMKLPFDISDCRYDKESVLDLSLWQKLHYLNTQHNADEVDSIKKALGRSVFRFARNEETGKFPFKKIEIQNAVRLRKVGRTL